jgi:hypothetical protein
MTPVGVQRPAASPTHLPRAVPAQRVPAGRPHQTPVTGVPPIPDYRNAGPDVYWTSSEDRTGPEAVSTG